jgi:hypothetical protein
VSIPLRRGSTHIVGLLAGTLLVAMPGILAQNPEPPQSQSGSSSAQRPNGNAASRSEIGPYTYSPSPEDYYGWVRRVGGHNDAIRHAVAEGKETIPAPWHFTKYMHISETEEEPLRNIALIAHEQLLAVEASFETETQGCPRDCLSPAKRARIDDLMKQRNDILEEAMAQVKRELNDADYAKFSDWICHRCVSNRLQRDLSAPKQPSVPPQDQR